MPYSWAKNLTVVVIGEGPTASGKIKDDTYPPMDMAVCGGKLMIWLDLPGVKAEDINVYIQGNSLVVEGVKRFVHPGCKRFLRAECRDLPFHRVYTVPRPIDSANIHTDLKDGVLHISWSIQD
jgi:HSP20 family protein